MQWKIWNLTGIQIYSLIAWDRGLLDVVSESYFLFPSDLLIGWWKQNENECYFVLSPCSMGKRCEWHWWPITLQCISEFWILYINLLRQQQNPGWFFLSSWYRFKSRKQNQKTYFLPKKRIIFSIFHCPLFCPTWTHLCTF